MPRRYTATHITVSSLSNSEANSNIIKKPCEKHSLYFHAWNCKSKKSIILSELSAFSDSI